MNFSDIIFNPQWHNYTYQGKRLKSVTKFCSQFKPPFERDYWAEKKAEEAGITKADILAQWKAKADKSREKGTFVHSHIEKVLTGAADDYDHFLNLNQAYPEQEAFDRLWGSMKADTLALEVEMIVGSGDLGLAGTVDTIVGRLGKQYIFDWKTNAKFTIDNPWGKFLLPPFDDLEESDLNYYSLQTSLYWLILDKHSDYQIDGAYIVHLSGDQYHIHKALDLRSRLLAHLVDAEEF